MAVIQCKMCGANLKITSGTQVVVCEYCGTSQVPFEEIPGTQIGGSEETFLQRAFLALEDGDFKKADEFCEHVLNANPENAWAYLGKLLAELRLTSKEMLKSAPFFQDSKNFKRLMQFAEKSQENDLLSFMTEVIQQKTEMQYLLALIQMQHATNVSDYEIVIKRFQSTHGYRNSAQKIAECQALKAEAQKWKTYKCANAKLEQADFIQTLQSAQDMFQSIAGWRDVDEKIAECELKKKKLRRSRILKATFWLMVAGIIFLITNLYINSF